jgi:4-hydroxy-3-polyprenylbenzoate decarboxylase
MFLRANEGGGGKDDIMAFDNLRQFIAALEKEGELARIREEVDPILEVTEIADRVMKRPDGGKALLFERVRASGMPLLINAFGSRRRMQMVCGAEKISEVTEQFLAMLEPRGSLSFLEKLKMLPRLKQINDIFPVEVKPRQAPCMEVIVEDPSFDLMPVCQCWPQDGGRYITMAMTFSRDPATGASNCGLYRLQVFDSKTCGMHWHLHKGGAEHLRKMKERGEVLPVTVVVGAGPAEMFSAACPLPPDVFEMMFAGLLRGEPVRMVRCRTNDLLVPAEAEIVLEGYVDPGELRLEGPFGDHTGYYSLADMYPVFHLTAMSMRRDPVYPHTIVGIPPMEDCYMGEAIEDLFNPILKKQFPEIVDMHMPMWGCFHNLMLVALKKSYPGHARKIMHGIWGLGQAMFTKCIVVVDHDVNLRNYGEVTWRAFNCVDWAHDIEVVKGPVDDLDHASYIHRFGGKIGVDATTKWASEGFTRPWPDVIRMSDEVKRRVDAMWPRLGL